jgi:hypothetical protein
MAKSDAPGAPPYDIGDNNILAVAPYTKVTAAVTAIMQTVDSPQTVFTVSAGFMDSAPGGCDNFEVRFNIHRGNPNAANSIKNKPYIPVYWDKCLLGWEGGLIGGNVASGVLHELIQAGLLVEAGEKDPANARVIDAATGVYVQLVRQTEGEPPCDNCPSNACAMSIINNNKVKLFLPSENFKIKLAVRRGIVAGCGVMGALESID